MAGYDNLPGTHPEFEDGNLSIAAASDTPITVVFGTAARGDATTVYNVDVISNAVARFGRTEGTLMRGIYEAYQGGASAIKGVRIGSKAATLTPVGAGITIETIERDDLAGQNVKLYFDDSTGRLRVWRVSDDLLVYDMNKIGSYKYIY